MLVGDIEKAFLNIKVHAEDRDCLRFYGLETSMLKTQR